MLSESQLPKRFWAEAINTACYVQNRCMLNRRHNVTPYEIWNGRKPNVSYFHVFGSKCYILKHKEQLKTFEEKADESIFLGYEPNIKAFRVFNKRKMKLEVSIHVKFDDAKKTVSTREVKIAARETGAVAVAEGLPPGARVVTAGVHSLTNGQSVKVPEEPSR